MPIPSCFPSLSRPMKLLFTACLLLSAAAAFSADQLLVEAESFQDSGTWVLDTQFIEIMGSLTCWLMAWEFR